MKRGILVPGAGEQLNGTVTGGQAGGHGQAGLHGSLQRRLIASRKPSQLHNTRRIVAHVAAKHHRSLDKLINLGSHGHDTTNLHLTSNIDQSSLWITAQSYPRVLAVYGLETRQHPSA